MSKLIDKFHKDLNSAHLSQTDLIVILTHPVIGLIIWFAYQKDLLDQQTLKDYTSSYIFLHPLLLVVLFFKKLRNIKFYLAWLTMSVIQVYIYTSVKDNPDFAFPHGTSFDSLVALLPTLLMFQLFRQIFYSIKGKEMIMSIRYYRITMYQTEDRRNMTWIEAVFSVVLMLTAAFSGVLLTKVF